MSCWTSGPSRTSRVHSNHLGLSTRVRHAPLATSMVSEPVVSKLTLSELHLQLAFIYAKIGPGT